MPTYNGKQYSYAKFIQVGKRKAYKIMVKNNLCLYKSSATKWSPAVFIVAHPDGLRTDYSGESEVQSYYDACNYMENNTSFMTQNSNTPNRKYKTIKLLALTYEEVTYLLDLIPDRDRWRFLIKKLQHVKDLADVNIYHDTI